MRLLAAPAPTRVRGKRLPAVALLVETSNAYARGLLEGVVAYVREHDAWSLYLPELRRGEVPSDWLTRWKGDGIIARVENIETARAVKRTRLPVVNMSAARHLPEAPWVETDDAAIADSLAWAYHLRGQTARALPLLEEAARADPGGSLVNEHLGDVYWALGRKYEARYAWHAAAVYAANDATARIEAKLAGGPAAAD